jgi:hypothetical protein
MRPEEQLNFYEIVQMLYSNNRGTHYIEIRKFLPMSECGQKYIIEMHYLYKIEVFLI